MDRKPVEKQRRLILLLWGLCVVGILAPYGVIYEIREAQARQEKLFAQSPLHKLCDKCGRPATHSQSYSASTRYFCDKHWPPPKTVSFSPGKHGKGFSPWFCIILILIIYVLNSFRAVVHFVSRGKHFNVTLSGAVTGVVFLIVFWIFFFLKYRISFSLPSVF